MAFEAGHKINKGRANPNGGRKTDKDLSELKRVMDDAIPYEDRVEIFRVSAARARAGDSAHTKIILGYLYGTPVQRMQDENGGAIIRVWRVDDRPPAETPASGAGDDTE